MVGGGDGDAGHPRRATRVRIIVPPAGAVELTGFGVGLPATHDSSRTGGNGFISVTRPFYYLNGIANNTANDSVNIFDWLIENAGLSLPWGLPLVFNWRNVLLRLDANQSVLGIMMGGLAGYNAALPFTQWRTDVSRKRAGIIIERDALGVTRTFLSWATGGVQGNKQIVAIPGAAVCSLIYEPNPLQLRLFVNGVLHDQQIDADLPFGVQTDGIFFSLGVAKELISVPETSMRLYAPMLMAARRIT